MLTVHASGGGKMLRAAVEAGQAAKPDMLVLAVTVLTSLDEDELGKLVCAAECWIRSSGWPLLRSPTDARAWSPRPGGGRPAPGIWPDFTIVTPGVRPAGSGHDDQARVVTPAEAIAAGASHIVVGRPITEATDPAAEARAILGQIGSRQYPGSQIRLRNHLPKEK